jgi:UDP-N-acetylmuramoylalanine--D-glutamate ligase
MELSQKTVLVLGLGESGLAMSRWCAEEGARVRVADTRAEPRTAPLLRETLPAAELVCGPFTPELLDGADLVAISPGLAPTKAPQAQLLTRAAERNIPVVSEIELFAWALAELKQAHAYAPRVLAVTGTNGKTTVASLAGAMCRRAGRRTLVAGNISPAALDALREARTRGSLPDVWVLELSSFQLHATTSLDADAAALLNVSEDHLDWHGTLDAYGADKARVFGAHSVRVFNRDDAISTSLAARPGDAPVSTLSFGLSAPEAAGEFGLLDAAGVRWLAFAEGEGPPAVSTRRSRAPAAPPLPPTLRRLMPVDALRIRGAHNAANALAALALCHAIELPMAPLLHALREYSGEPHRVELVSTIDGVEYFDDSKGTNVGATVAALQGLGRPVILIAGGDGKGQDFSPLARPVAAHARAVLLIGRDAPLVRRALETSAAAVSLIDCASLEAAVEQSARIAQAGDAVLLSPACASYDMFTDYTHRARVFRAAVARLAHEERASC